MNTVLEAYLCSDDVEEFDDFLQAKKPVWILGKCYNGVEDMEKMHKDILSKIWCTYRKGFAPIGGGDGLTTDKGWGCMLRCGQMIVAQALVYIHLGRDWIWTSQTKERVYLNILQKIEDKRSAPYSIHQIALMGQSEGKSIGEWFGPNTVAQVLRKLILYDEWKSFKIHVALDNLIVMDEVYESCSEGDKSNSWKPLLLIVPVRLGVLTVNPLYVNSLKKCFELEQSLGIIGGKPNLALYFIGCVEDELIYLDPHKLQNFVEIGNKDTEEQIEIDKTYHSTCASRMNILSMDPSVAICFLCKTRADFDNLCEKIKQDESNTEHPAIFYINKERYKQWTDESVCSGETTATKDSNLNTELEEFEFI